jgi:hypothetical protein
VSSSESLPDSLRNWVQQARIDAGGKAQRGLPCLRQPAADQPSAALVLDLDAVMGLGPVVADEQHPQRSLALDLTPSSRAKDRVALVDRCSDQQPVGTPSHQSSRLRGSRQPTGRQAAGGRRQAAGGRNRRRPQTSHVPE